MSKQLQRKAIVDNFCRAGTDRLVNNKWVTANQCSRHINNYFSLAGAARPFSGGIQINGNTGRPSIHDADNVIRNWLVVTVKEQRVDHGRLVYTAGWCLGVFYADDGMVESQDADWLQHLMNVLVGLFRRHGFTANVDKSCTTMLQPGALRLGMSEEAKALKYMGVGYS